MGHCRRNSYLEEHSQFQTVGALGVLQFAILAELRAANVQPQERFYQAFLVRGEDALVRLLQLRELCFLLRRLGLAPRLLP